MYACFYCKRQLYVAILNKLIIIIIIIPELTSDSPGVGQTVSLRHDTFQITTEQVAWSLSRSGFDNPGVCGFRIMATDQLTSDPYHVIIYVIAGDTPIAWCLEH